MKSSTLNALIVGVGNVGERHIRAQVRYGNPIGVYDVSSEKAASLARKLKVQSFTDLHEALQWADLVHICTPDNLHIEIAVEATKLGKHILCEKPVTTSLQDTYTLLALTKKHKTYFFVGNNYRLTPTFLEIKKRVNQEQLGKVISIYTTYLHDMREYHKKTPWRLQQNFLYGGAIHAIDLLCWIVGERVVSVYAQTGKKVMQHYTEPEDYHINLTFASGLVGTVWANARVVLPVHKTDVHVYAEKGTYIANNKSGVLRIYRQKMEDYIDEKFTVGYRLTIPSEIEIVNKYVLGRTKTHAPVPQLGELVPLMQILDAAEKSIVQGTVITVS